MKKIYFLLLLFALFSCEKDETSMIGVVKMVCHSQSEDYSHVTIYIYSAEIPDYFIDFGQPDQNGIYKKELLQGNYLYQVFLNGISGGRSAMQILGDRTTELKFEF